MNSQDGSRQAYSQLLVLVLYPAAYLQTLVFLLLVDLFVCMADIHSISLSVILKVGISS